MSRAVASRRPAWMARTAALGTSPSSSVAARLAASPSMPEARTRGWSEPASAAPHGLRGPAVGALVQVGRAGGGRQPYAWLMVIRWPLAVVAGLLALLLAAGCTTAASAPRAAAGTSRTTPHRAGLAGGHGAAGAAPGSITLAFAGDVNFADRTARLLEDPATAFGPISAVLRSADFAAVNLETAVTSRGAPQPKTYHFRTSPVAFTALRDAGIDLVTMANNHVLDYGPAGLADTLAAARTARFRYVGIGMNAAAAWAPYLTTIHGVKIAVIGVSQVAELASSWVATASRPGEANAIDLGRTLAAVRTARRLASVVIVFMHWGTEGQACPDPAQLALAPRLAAAGASIIIGAHAHILQGSGWLGHTFVAYGLGNFLWWEHSYSTATGVLELTLRPHAPLTARFIPAVVSGAGQPIVDRGAAARRAAAHYASLRACAQLAANPSLVPGTAPCPRAAAADPGASSLSSRRLHRAPRQAEAPVRRAPRVAEHKTAERLNRADCTVVLLHPAAHRHRPGRTQDQA